MYDTYTVKVPCPFCQDEDEEPAMLTIDVYLGHPAKGNDPEDPPCIEDVSGCHHVVDPVDDDILLDVALSAAADADEEAFDAAMDRRLHIQLEG